MTVWRDGHDSLVVRYRTARPWLIALFLSILVAAQLGAVAGQVDLGYRPFVHPPGRVPLSWDMFAQPIERCEVRWTPPLQVHGREVSAMPELGPGIEWDAVLDSSSDYEELGLDACVEFGRPDAHVVLTCFLPEGRTTHREIPCS